MIARIATVAALALSALALTACSDKPQELKPSGVKADQAPYQGVATKSQFVERGWQPGDRNSWEQQLRQRAAYGQNEYTRIN
jgi:hypothetical protein